MSTGGVVHSFIASELHGTIHLPAPADLLFEEVSPLSTGKEDV
jgi:hypothetical protein